MKKGKKFSFFYGCHEKADGSASGMQVLSFSDEQQYACTASSVLWSEVGSSPLMVLVSFCEAVDYQCTSSSDHERLPPLGVILRPRDPMESWRATSERVPIGWGICDCKDIVVILILDL
jgi:hypothetical protein